MPAKTTSPEAAQRKLWKAEIRTHEQAARKIKSDFRAEQKRLHKQYITAKTALEKFDRRAEKQMPKQLSSIDSRIAILKGRLGI
jgi:fructose-1,6-bisphosphatase/inositol monophosphatase family enzyme